MSYRATPQASTGVTPNMMMLGRQTRLPLQAIYGAPLEPDGQEQTVSEYVTALQDGLRATYRHARVWLQRAAMHQRHDYDGKVQRREYQAGELVWIHDATRGRDRGRKLQFPWLGPCLITKVLDRGRVVVRRKRAPLPFAPLVFCPPVFCRRVLLPPMPFAPHAFCPPCLLPLMEHWNLNRNYILNINISDKVRVVDVCQLCMVVENNIEIWKVISCTSQ